MRKENHYSGSRSVQLLLSVVVLTLLFSAAFAQPGAPKPKLPDLTVRNHMYMPDVAIINQPVTISCEVHNKGDLPCEFTTLEIKCNNDPTIPTTYHEIDPMHPKEFHPVQREITFTQPGTYIIDLTADIYDVIEEHNENDNRKRLEIIVYDPGADLVVDSLTIDPLDPTTSDTITINAVVKNVGETSATASVLEIDVIVNAMSYPTTHSVPILWPGDDFLVQRDITNPLLDCYDIVATADVDDVVMERFEDNNVAQEGFCVKTYGPDLIVELSNSPEDPTTLDDPVSVIALVQNIGNTPSTSCTLELQILDPDAGFDVLEFGIPPINGRESFPLVYDITGPLAGNYHVWADIDIYDDVDESIEDNNDDYHTFNVTEARPDLTVESLTHAPEKPTTIDTVTITAVVKNDGFVAAGPSTLAIKVGDEALPMVYPVPPLDPGQSAPIQRIMQIGTEGLYLVEATADFYDVVDESNENQNNVAYDAIEVFAAPKPDLEVTTLDHAPANPNTDDMVTITAIVENTGREPAGSSVLLLTVDGTPTSYTVPALDPAETHQVQQQENFPMPGDYDVLAVADAGDDVDEQHENNNTATDTITVTPAPRPDLVINSLTHAPTDPTTWDIVTITAIVENIGNAQATSSTLALQLGSEPVPANFPIPALNPGDTYQVQRVESIPTPGTYTATAEADVNDDVDESNENNNVATDDITVTLPEVPDLALTSLTHAPADPFTFETITITAVVENIGNAQATTSTLVIDIGGEPTPASYELPPMDIGTSITIQRMVDLAAGDYMVMATADADDAILELNENNNTATDNILVRAPGPDLIVSSLTHSPTPPTIWDTITITAIVENAGNAAATSSTLAIKAGGETFPPTYPVPALLPGETFQVQRQLSLPVPNSYQVIATADVNDDVAESVENNNTAVDIFDVVLPDAPDLVISSLSYSPPTALTSDTITITAEAQNIGGGSATTSTLCILVGDELVPVCYEIPPLAVMETFQVQRDIVFSQVGSYLVTATADADDDLLEIVEDNNTDTIEIMVYETIMDKLKDYLLGKVMLTPQEMELYDFNDDGVVDIADLVTMILL